MHARTYRRKHARAKTYTTGSRNYIIIVQLQFPFVRTLTTYDLDVGPFIQITETLFQRLQRFNQHSVSKGKRRMQVIHAHNDTFISYKDYRNCFTTCIHQLKLRL